jgi:predicted PurR-regulated permease PerM
VKNAPILNLFLALVIVIAVGWLLWAGRPILLPIAMAAISAYIMVSTVEALERVPVLRHLPAFVLRMIVLAAFIVTFMGLAFVLAATVREIIAVAPVYEANLTALLDRTADRFGLDARALRSAIEAATIGRMDLEAMAIATLGSFASVGFTVFLVVIYAGFLVAERGSFPAKLSAALADAESKAKAHRVLTEIDVQIRQYLAVKTLINLILGAISYAILRVMGVDFAFFWAIMIALLNYIPYVGSYLGVAFPVILSLGQFASLPAMLSLLALLTAAQFYVGNVLEPRWIGRQLNMSPFVVLVALSVWAALWGIPGAILAIPMTSILIIVTSNFEATRFVAVLLSERVDPAPPTGAGIAGPRG